MCKLLLRTCQRKFSSSESLKLKPLPRSQTFRILMKFCVYCTLGLFVAMLVGLSSASRQKRSDLSKSGREALERAYPEEYWRRTKRHAMWGFGGVRAQCLGFCGDDSDCTIGCDCDYDPYLGGSCEG